MTKQIKLQSFFLVIPLLLVLSLYLITQTNSFQSFPEELSRGLTLDFLITVPLLYFLIVRKNKNISNLTVASVFVLSMVAASFIIPSEHQTLLNSVKFFAIPIVELSVFGFILYKIRTIIIGYKQSGSDNLDFYDALVLACKNTFPGKVGQLLASEISVVYYLFFAKKKTIFSNQYTYYKKSGIKSVVWVMIGLIFAETFVLHVFASRWSNTLAWVLTILSLYSCMQIIALLRSMALRMPEINLETKEIILKYGFFAQTKFPISEITKIYKNTRSLPEDKSIIQFSPLGFLDSHNIIVELKSEHVLTKMYGIKKKYNSIAIFIDEKDKFIHEVNSLISNNI